MEPVTLYIANVDALPESILRSILDTQGIEVIGTDRDLLGGAHDTRGAEDRESSYWNLLVRDIESRGPRVVIFGHSNRPLAGQLIALLETRLLMLSTRGATVDVCELHADCEAYVELGAQELISLIRAVGQRTDRTTANRR